MVAWCAGAVLQLRYFSRARPGPVLGLASLDACHVGLHGFFSGARAHGPRSSGRSEHERLVRLHVLFTSCVGSPLSRWTSRCPLPTSVESIHGTDRDSPQPRTPSLPSSRHHTHPLPTSPLPHRRSPTSHHASPSRLTPPSFRLPPLALPQIPRRYVGSARFRRPGKKSQTVSKWKKSIHPSKRTSHSPPRLPERHRHALERNVPASAQGLTRAALPTALPDAG